MRPMGRIRTQFRISSSFIVCLSQSLVTSEPLTFEPRWLLGLEREDIQLYITISSISKPQTPDYD